MTDVVTRSWAYAFVDLNIIVELDDEEMFTSSLTLQRKIPNIPKCHKKPRKLCKRLFPFLHMFPNDSSSGSSDSEM